MSSSRGIQYLVFGGLLVLMIIIAILQLDTFSVCGQFLLFKDCHDVFQSFIVKLQTASISLNTLLPSIYASRVRTYECVDDFVDFVRFDDSEDSGDSDDSVGTFAWVEVAVLVQAPFFVKCLNGYQNSS